MSYNQVTDIQIEKPIIDFKENVSKLDELVDVVYLDNNICIKFKKDKWYFTVADVALWTKCGKIKTVLFYRLRKRPLGQIHTFHGKEQFMFRYKNQFALYTVNVYSRSYGATNHDQNKITDVGFTKTPNLKECSI